MKKKILLIAMVFMLIMTMLPVTAWALSSDSQISITIDDGATSAVPGTTQTYMIIVSNNASSVNETGVGVYCTLPSEIANDPYAAWTVEATSNGGNIASGASGSGNVLAMTPPSSELMTVIDLPANSSVTFKLTVQIRSSATGSLSIKASITGDYATATDTDTLTPEADLAVTISDSKDTLIPGASAPYTITVTNNGPSDVTGASLSSPLPTGAVSANWGPNSYGQSGYANPSSGSGELTSSLSLSTGASYTFWYTVQTDPGATGVLSTTATITAPSGVTDPAAGNNSATDTDGLAPETDMEVWIAFGDQTGNAADEVTLDVNIYNHGPSAATGITLSAPLPAGVSLVSAAPDAGTTYDPSTGVWTVGTLEPYDRNVLTIKAAVDSSATRTMTASVLGADVPDPDTSNNSASLTVTDKADVAVTVSVDYPAPNVGDTVTFTVTVTNSGPNDATDVYALAPLLSELTYVNDTASTGYYDPDYGWEVGSLSSGTSETLTIQATVSSSGAKAFSAQVESAVPDPDTSNNSAGVTVIPSPAFVPVTGITGVPTTATAGTPLTLSGTVAPANATNQTVVWSLESAGATGATVSGNTLSTTVAGTVTVRATITNGLTTSSNYTQDFTITVSAAPVTSYTVTFNSNGSLYTTKTVNGGQSIGSVAWPADPARSSYTFGGWFTGENGAGTQFTSATPVNATITVYAKWTYSGGSGGSSSGGGSAISATQTYNADVSTGDGSDFSLPVTVDKSSGNASVDAGSESNLMSEGKTTVITVPSVPDVDTYTLGIPVSNLSTTGVQGTLTFDTNTGSITVPSNMLTGVTESSGSKAEIFIGQGDKDNLPDSVKAAISDKPLVQITLSIDGKQTDWSNPNATVTVSIPYTPTAAELDNPESIVIWYIDGAGNVITIPNGHYDSVTGTVTFNTTHFSDYAVAYNRVSFTDVADTTWYSDAVGFIAARGITIGTGNGCYSPDATLTRGQFITLVMRAYNIESEENGTDNFSDAGNTYYTGYLAEAKRLGISNGVGGNKFAPEQAITRQEMFTLLYNALKVLDRLPQGDSGKTLSDFSDSDSVADWAEEALMMLVETGTAGGSNGALTPLSTTTRAEMAQVLYNLLGK